MENTLDTLFVHLPLLSHFTLCRCMKACQGVSDQNRISLQHIFSIYFLLIFALNKIFQLPHDVLHNLMFKSCTEWSPNPYSLYSQCPQTLYLLHLFVRANSPYAASSLHFTLHKAASVSCQKNQTSWTLLTGSDQQNWKPAKPTSDALCPQYQA